MHVRAELREEGLEPSTYGLKIRCSSQLSYSLGYFREASGASIVANRGGAPRLRSSRYAAALWDAPPRRYSSWISFVLPSRISVIAFSCLSVSFWISSFADRASSSVRSPSFS